MSDSLEFRPRCEMQLAGGDPAQVLERMNRRIVDCAVLLMPLDTDRYHVQQISRSPMVVCLRSDDSLASEPALELGEIASRIKVFPDPQAQPAAHSRLIDLFKELALPMQVTCSASKPADMQWMVKAGYGLALIDQLSPSMRA